MPLDTRTHGHGHGYLDLNFLIPELLATSRYRKGSYSAQVGDFSSAGSVGVRLLRAPAGNDPERHGRRFRLLPRSRSRQSGRRTRYADRAVDVARYDGPWDLPEDLRQNKFYLSYASELPGGRARVTLQGYDGRWKATDQIPRRAVAGGGIGPLGFIDPDPDGESQRYSLTGAVDLERWKATVYVVDYRLSLFSNFTYLLDDPVASDEFEQTDDRTVWGAAGSAASDRNFAGRPATLRGGAELRYDDIDEVGLYSTDGRLRNASIRHDAVGERSVGVWGEAEYRASFGARVLALMTT